MSNLLLFAALMGCGSAPTEPTEAPKPELHAPKPATTPPQPQALPPAAEAKGGPMLLIPGNYLPEELDMNEGEAIQLLCGDRLVESRVEFVPVGEGRIHPTGKECPQYTVLFRGLEDRLGSGSIRAGIGKGPFARQKPKIYDIIVAKGHIQAIEIGPEKDRGYRVEMVPEGEDPVVLYEMTKSTGTAGLIWNGDLDDDNVPDFVFNSPITREDHHLRLFLSAKSADGKPELAAEKTFTLW